MKLVVLVKQVPIVSQMGFDAETRTLRREGVRLEVSSFDLRALSRAVELRDELGGEVVVCTMGPPQAREALVKKAKDAAEKVHRWGDVVELEPMTAFDRRIIHQALKEDSAIETQSVAVEGTDKKAILLRPKH